MSRLRDRMVRDMELRRFAQATQNSYLWQVEKLVEFYGGTPPGRMDGPMVQDYLHHLITVRNLASCSVDLAAAAIRFLFTETLGRPEISAAPPPPRRRGRRLPEILSRAEIQRLLSCEPNLKHRTMLMSAYGAGLRRGELVQMKVSDIDRERLVLHVRKGQAGRSA